MQNPPDQPEKSLVPLNPREGLNMGALTGDRITAATHDMPDHHRETLRWLFSLSRTMGWNLTDLKRETGIDDSTLYRVFTNTYPTKIDGIVRRIDSFRATFEDRAQRLRAGKVFVETSICKSIWETCDYAAATNTMALIYSPSHWGKTWALSEYQANHNHGQTKMVRMPASAGVQLAMKEFARACYVSPKSCFDNLRESVLNAIDSHNLLIVDELHEVFLSYQRGSAVKCLEVIREIHDRTGCGMVLSGTLKLQAELMLGEHKDLLKQFVERSVVEVVLKGEFPWHDIVAIAHGYGLKEPKGQEAEIVRHITKGHGIKRYCHFLTNGQTLAAKKKQPFSWRWFITAHDIVARLAQGNQPGERK